MTQLTDTPAPFPAAVDAQALIEEARRHRRKRWRQAGFWIVVVALVAGVVGVSLAGGPPPPARHGANTRPAHVATVFNQSQERPAWPTGAWVGPGALAGASCVAQTCVAVGYSNMPSSGSALGPGPATGRALVSSDAGHTWSVGTVPTGVGELESVSCPTATVCVAVGYATATGTTSSDSTSSGSALVSADAGQSWRLATVPAATVPLTSVSCTTMSDCAAAGPASSAPGAVVAVHTVDGGLIWTPSALPGGVLGVTDLSCAPRSTCMATGTAAAALVLVSDDAGASWTDAVTPTPTIRLQYEAATINFTDVDCATAGHCIVAGDGDGDRLSEAFVTVDGGRSWAMADWGDSGDVPIVGAPDSIWCSPAGRCVAFANDAPHPFGTELMSDDGGLTWTTLGPSGAAAGASEVGTLTCSSVSSCVMVGVGSSISWMFAAWTADGGTTWNSAAIPDVLDPLSDVSCWNTRGCVAVGDTAGNEGATLVTTDSGRTWSTSPLPPDTRPLQAVSCPGPGSCVAVTNSGTGNAATEVLRTTNGGATWSEAPASIPGLVMAMTCPSASTCWAVGGHGTLDTAFVAVTLDGGQSWQTNSAPNGPSELTALSCPSPRTCVAIGGNGATARSFPVAVERLGVSASGSPRMVGVGTVDGGQEVLGLDCLTATRCLMGADTSDSPPVRRVLETTDGGAMWRVVERMPDRYGDVEGVTCTSSSVCIAVGRGAPGKGAGVVLTEDGGRTWATAPVPVGVGNLSQVTCTTSTHCVAVGSLLGPAGIVVTNDGGRLWEPATLPAWTVDSG